ncbi:MAG: class I SAM-dependent methyltransferase [Candidatus Sphingomonas phytovorans]|nr:class I SAM-dependent methyltransferase [Sphingomonas sp.]WEJ99492.1 MAG: class I SAM-dependent methyltransferase [Sphingomonas sp.]
MPEPIAEQVLEDVSPVLGDAVVIWGRWAIPGWLDDSNIRLINHCMRHLPTEDPIIEIGSFCGVSTVVMARIKQLAAIPNKIISSDPWRFEGADFTTTVGDSQITFTAYREHVKRLFLSATGTFAPGEPPLHFEEYSDSFFDKWAGGLREIDSHNRSFQLGGPIAMAYIDGDHTYEQSRQDFINCDRFLVPGGFIVFDDSADGTDWGSHRAAVEVLERSDYKLVAKGPNYCFQKVG